MREIKFRCWDKRYKEFTDPCGVVVELNDDLNKQVMYKTMVLSQYTGLKDKNGKEIYEGDILQGYDKEGVLEVLWKERTAGFTIKSYNLKNPINHFLSVLNTHSIEIIGNIYENEDLLEEATNGLIPRKQP